MAAKFVVRVEVSGEGSRSLTPEELQRAISFGLNWHHGHHYTKAVFKVEAQRAIAPGEAPCEGCKPRPMCRDCADNDGTCPNDGLPCAPAARHTCGKYSAPGVTGLASVRSAQALAERFHEAYERLAPRFGYTTRPETRAFDPQSANGRLMVAVCQELLAPGVLVSSRAQPSGDPE